MKKFLVFLLIAIITCEAVEELYLKGYETPYDILKERCQKVKEILINYGKKAAVDYCTKFLSQKICQTAVDCLASALGL